MRKYEDNNIRRRGVNLIHLFNKVWRAGKVIRKKDKPAHLVIYSPEDVEFHVYGKEAGAFYPGMNIVRSGIWIKPR